MDDDEIEAYTSGKGSSDVVRVKGQGEGEDKWREGIKAAGLNVRRFGTLKWMEIELKDLGSWQRKLR